MATESDGVETLLGEPRKALRSVAWPILVSLLVTQFITLADSIWCSGLGVDALSSISFFSPIYWMIAGIGTGMGIGLAALISYAIGSSDRDRASHYLTQGMGFMTVLSFACIVPLLLLVEPVLGFMGGSEIMDDCLEYAIPLVIMTPIIVLNCTIMGSLRGEGDSRRTMKMNLITAGANIIIDPLLIYGVGLGLTGAALSTGISSAISLGLGLHWYALGKTYVPMSFRGFRFSGKTLGEILKVGGPQILEYDLMYAFNIFLFFFVSNVGGSTGVALYNTPWRLIHVAVAPIEAIGSAIVPVASAAFGQRDPDKARRTYKIAFTNALVIGVALAVFLALFADELVLMFSYEPSMAGYREELADVLRIYSVFLPFFGLCFVGAGIVQSMKLGTVSLISAIVRNFILVAFYAWASTVSMTAIYWSTTAAEIIGGIMAMVLAAYFIAKECPRVRDSGMEDRRPSHRW